MLGRTHVVGTLALGHVALLGYLSYKNAVLDNPSADAAYSEPFEFLGFSITSPMDIVTYVTLILSVLFFVLLLLRVGGGKLRLLYLALVVLAAGVGYLFGGVDYGPALMGVLILFALGSLFPDIDTPTSTIGRYFPFVGRIIGHRTVTHTIWAVAVLGVAVWYFESIYVFSFVTGYTIHIIQDSFSRQGIAWFYPLIGGYDTFGSGAAMKKGRKPGIFAYHTGGLGEEIFFYSSIGLHLVCTGVVLWQHFN